MRYDDGMIYEEYKEGVSDMMQRRHYDGWSVKMVTDCMTEEDNDMLRGTSLALWIISIGEYEVRHDILEERVLKELSYHIPRFHMGRYTEDLSPEECEQVKADVEYIESKVTLMKVKSLEDRKEEDE